MKSNPTGRAAEPAGAPPRCGPNPPHLLDLVNEGLVKQIAPHSLLPCWADRQKIIEEAKLVLTEAQVIVEQLDRTFARLSAE